MKTTVLSIIILTQLLTQTAAAVVYLDQIPINNYTEPLPDLYIRGFGSSPASERESLLPWKLIINPRTDGTCPSVSLKLGLFAVVNVFAAIGAFIFGCRSVVHVLSCTLLGKPKEDNSLAYIRNGIIGAVLTLAGHAVNGYILHKAGAPETVGRIMILLAFRPRASMAHIMAGQWLPRDDYRFGGKSATVAEIVSATISFVTACIALAYGVPRGNLLFGHKETLATQDAHIMYAGALMYVIFYPVIVGVLVMSLLADKVRGIMGVIIITVFSFCSLCSQWFFWAGFIRLASDL